MNDVCSQVNVSFDYTCFPDFYISPLSLIQEKKGGAGTVFFSSLNKKKRLYMDKETTGIEPTAQLINQVSLS